MTTVGSLCTGYGGLELALTAMGVDHTVEWISETDRHAASLLADRFAAANIGDLIGATPPPVDIITAGFPCQPFSTAGHRKGLHDERWIWDDIETLIRRMDPPPGLLLLENVPGLLTANHGNAMGRIVEGLAAAGYVGSYWLLRASDVGACHQRRRWFCVATHTDRNRIGSNGRIHRGDDTGGDQPFGAPLPPRSEGTHTTDTPTHHLPTPQASDGTRGPDYARAARRHTHGSGGNDLTTATALLPTPTATDSRGSRNSTVNRQPGNTASTGHTLNDIHHAQRWGDFTEVISRHETILEQPAPDPTTNGRLSPRFVEWMMMLPEGWVTDTDLPRTAQLRILGNGVVPLQAAVAYQAILSA